MENLKDTQNRKLTYSFELYKRFYEKLLKEEGAKIKGLIPDDATLLTKQDIEEYKKLYK